MLSLHFRTDSDGLPSGTVNYNEADSAARAGFLSLSLARGDFDSTQLGDSCFTSEAAGFLARSFSAAPASGPFVCALLPDSDYYINMHFGDSLQPGADGSFCQNPAGCTVIGGTQQL